MTSLNFLNKISVALPLILLTIFDLKMQTLLNLVGLYFLNLKTFFIIKLLMTIFIFNPYFLITIIRTLLGIVGI